MSIPLKERAKMFVFENKYSVFPTGKNKIPLVPWIQFQKRFPTEQEIEDWWTKWPEAQIGIVTGKISDLTVVDVENGGDTTFLPQETTIVRTGGKGFHYFFTYCEGIKNATRIRDLTDIRSEGGYVVSPYSTSDKGPYEYIKQVDKLLPFPKELFPNKNIYSGPSLALTGDKPMASNLVTNSISQEIIDGYPGYEPGNRNAEMARLIGRVLSRINPVHWDTVGIATIVKANDKNTPPLTPRELQTTYNSIKGIRTRETPIGGLYGTPTSVQGVSKEPVDREKESDEVKLMSLVAADQKINTSDIYPLEMKCFDEAIMGGLCAGDLVIISGQTSQGKTALALDWTVSLLRGIKKSPVLWFSYEVLPSALWAKFKTIGVEDNELIIMPAKHTSGNVSWLEEKIKEAKKSFNAKVVVIDHLGFLLPKTTGVLGKDMGMNYAAYLTQIVRDIKTIALQEELIIILPVHMKKTENIDMDAIKDSAGIGQESDLVFLIERERNKGKESKSYFTDFTKITLAKNRKTGKTVSAWFTMIKERFAYDQRNNEEDDGAWGAFGKEKEEPVKEKEVEKKQESINDLYNSF